MKRLLAIFLISILNLSCQHIDKPEKPEDLIDRDILVEVLVDTYLSNAVRSKTFQEIKDGNIRLEKYVYQKYAIDSLQFARSNAYYSTDMDGYLKILKEVELKLIELKGEGEPKPEEAVDDFDSEKNKDPDESKQ